MAVEIAPDDIVEKMARELREKEEQMQKMLEQQNKVPSTVSFLLLLAGTSCVTTPL